MPEATTSGVLEKKVFFKMSQNSQETPVPEETPVFCKIFKNTSFTEHCFIALAKIPGCKGSISPPCFYGNLPGY